MFSDSINVTNSLKEEKLSGSSGSHKVYEDRYGKIDMYIGKGRSTRSKYQTGELNILQGSVSLSGLSISFTFYQDSPHYDSILKDLNAALKLKKPNRKFHDKLVKIVMSMLKPNEIMSMVENAFTQGLEDGKTIKMGEICNVLGVHSTRHYFGHDQ
jgi:hypothetical protein